MPFLIRLLFCKSRYKRIVIFEETYFYMRLYLLLIPLFLCSSMTVLGQNKERKEVDFGKVSQEYYNLKFYDKDTTATAVVLFEKGRNTFEVVGDYIKLVKVVHRKIKIFDAKEYDGIEINIPYYHTKNATEKVLNIKAVTHNGTVKNFIDDKVIYDIDLSEKWS